MIHFFSEFCATEPAPNFGWVCSTAPGAQSNKPIKEAMHCEKVGCDQTSQSLFAPNPTSFEYCQRQKIALTQTVARAIQVTRKGYFWSWMIVIEYGANEALKVVPAPVKELV